MNPAQKLALLRNVMQASETRSTAVLKAEQEYAGTLRQLIDAAITNGDKNAEVASAESV